MDAGSNQTSTMFWTQGISSSVSLCCKSGSTAFVERAPPSLLWLFDHEEADMYKNYPLDIVSLAFLLVKG
ncbi:hypothetical protein H4Q26_003547 [Puccinia striiformis f. sp. tritici PST-130]|nr:hypothetical protein H4Q26_003547 [Puccinia striiformis f. sp. tritici PST-130]